MKWETAAGVFIKGDRMLMGKRLMSKDNYPGLWDIPAGHIKENESPEQCVVREIKEEIGVDVNKLEPLFSFSEKDLFSGRDYTHHIFLVREWKGEITFFDEMEEFGWFTLEEIKGMKKTFSDKMCEEVFNLYRKK